MELTIKEILKATNGDIKNCNNVEEKVNSISLDTRTIKRGDFYVPIIGNIHDGHEFISDAYKKGAVGVLTEKQLNNTNFKNVILVENTLKGLHDLAKYYRKNYDIPLIAVTGSTGKTTTKEMIASVLSKKYKTIKNYGNYNNEIGCPLTVLSINKEHEIGVLELGMNDFGEIKKLAEIVEPEIVVYTNIGLSHVGKLGSKENIFLAKAEAIPKLKQNGIVIYNADSDFLPDLKTKFPSINYKTFGVNNGDVKAIDIVINNAGIEFKTIINKETIKVKLPILGKANAYNALAAILVGVYFKIPINEILLALKEFNPAEMRMNILQNNNKKTTIINDVYNASPDSMSMALETLKTLGEQKAGRTIAILGDMLEMGDFSYEEHLNLGKKLIKMNIDIIITVGNNAKNIAKGALSENNQESFIQMCNNNEEAISQLDNIVRIYDVILVKGSRSLNMEEIVRFLNQQK